VIAVDTNILVYAQRIDSPWFGVADRCITELAESAIPWAIPWPCLHEFLSVVTNPRIYRPCTTLQKAIEQVESWLASPSLTLLGSGPAHWQALKRTIVSGKIIGPGIHDARIAALCLEHGVSTLWSADRDFSRFAGLKVVNPLIGGADDSETAP
jgi:toxin-antitoxin system PIN domain toxin